ncbi:histidinol-phosphate transaminase [Thalassolituus alkanivorans]|uniref:histidinol-phosphate transaminase n=1 Tax=Thalassolituus alkanivorans TaxID=2881055 RepID=UPI001E2E81B1|nr:histidinol-phosphate transaminase [Thalassolituus alkanivorans]MCB2385725.1 histidinol-phosphate transaminase [Thalassolituus alkanivorans]MCB2424087.1 histidinol-phosphate transaminase [Thalassolituus alkanivorans]
MAVDFQQLAVEGVRGLMPYQPGKPIDELARELGLKEADIVKLASNENPMGPSPKALAAIQTELADLTRYPDGAGFELKKALCNTLSSDAYQVAPEQITLGNGSSDILDFITRVFVNDGDEIVVSQHAFAIYELVARMVGARTLAAPAKDFGHDLDAMLALIGDKTRIVFITNPNNPTGTWLTKDELTAFLDNVPERVLVLLDEAYFEYVDEAEYPDGIQLLSRYPNLVITRTFSKAYGLASLRVGYGISSPQIADLLNRVRPPFNVDSFALAAAAAALSDDDYVAQSVAANKAGMQQLTAAFDALGLSFIPSVGNFIAFRVPDAMGAMDVYNQLLAKGVIVRPVANYEMPQYLRVSIGTQAENATFISALTAVLS